MVAAICINNFLSLHTSSVYRLASCMKHRAVPKTLWVLLAEELIKLYNIRYLKIVSRKCSFSFWMVVSRLCFLFSLRYSVMDHAQAGAVTLDYGSADCKSWTEQNFGECPLIQLKVLLEGPLQQTLLTNQTATNLLLYEICFSNPVPKSTSVCASLHFFPTAIQSQSKPRFYKISAKCEQSGSAWEKCSCVNKVLSLSLLYCADRRTDLRE